VKFGPYKLVTKIVTPKRDGKMFFWPHREMRLKFPQQTKEGEILVPIRGANISTFQSYEKKGEISRKV
jgi:hypothetical protein